MRHRKNSCKLNRTSSHRRCLLANMLKSLIVKGRMETTVAKAKAVQPLADQMVTLAKKNTLASRRRVIADLMIRFNSLTPKEAREAKAGRKGAYNDDRWVVEKLFGEIGPRFLERSGGYTRIIKKSQQRVGDNAQTCIIEYL